MAQVFSWREAPVADFAVIGDPVHHSRSPQMHAAAYSAHGLSYRYVPIHVLPGEVGPALHHLQQLGYQGVNVTVPHKEEALDWCTGEVDRFALAVRAANTLRLSTRDATNTDAPGFRDTLRDHLGTHGGEGRRCLVLGAGGSARALITALHQDGWQIRLYNRTRSRAEEIARTVPVEVVDEANPEGCDLILNTTSASLGGETLPILWDLASTGALAYDLAYGDSLPFLEGAKARGLATLDGLDLLVAQGARSFEWWLGFAPDLSAMAGAIR